MIVKPKPVATKELMADEGANDSIGVGLPPLPGEKVKIVYNASFLHNVV